MVYRAVRKGDGGKKGSKYKCNHYSKSIIINKMQSEFSFVLLKFIYILRGILKIINHEKWYDSIPKN